MALEHVSPVDPLEVVHHLEASSVGELALVSEDELIVLGVHGEHHIHSGNTGQPEDAAVLSIQIKEHFVHRQAPVAT